MMDTYNATTDTTTNAATADISSPETEPDSGIMDFETRRISLAERLEAAKDPSKSPDWYRWVINDMLSERVVNLIPHENDGKPNEIIRLFWEEADGDPALIDTLNIGDYILLMNNFMETLKDDPAVYEHHGNFYTLPLYLGFRNLIEKSKHSESMRRFNQLDMLTISHLLLSNRSLPEDVREHLLHAQKVIRSTFPNETYGQVSRHALATSVKPWIPGEDLEEHVQKVTRAYGCLYDLCFYFMLTAVLSSTTYSYDDLLAKRLPSTASSSASQD